MFSQRGAPLQNDGSAVDICILPITKLAEIKCGDDLAALVSGAFLLHDGDILVVAQKIVSKAEGRVMNLATVCPTEDANQLADEANKDPRLVQLILDESRRIVRVRPGLIIVEDLRGWVCANAGIDRSNVPQNSEGEWVLLLPEDPDRSARVIRDGINRITGKNIGVIVNDSHGRAWREGTVGVALGAAGVIVRSDRTGETDRYGYMLQHTVVATADELAAAASLVMGQGDESIPATVIRGLPLQGDGSAIELQRPSELDLFR